jgi:glycerol-3-phosphate dehydrogenase
MAIRAAFVADQALEYDRNTGVPPTHHLPPSRVLTLDEFLELVPQARGLGATGAALWHDYRTDEGDRLTLAFGLAAARFGAVLANYTEAIQPMRDGNRIEGMRVRDVVSGDTFEVRARVTVNATGAGLARLMAAFGTHPDFPLVKAMNVVTTREAGGPALALPSGDGSLLLLTIPWRGRLTVGTWYGTRPGDANDTRATVPEVSAFLDLVNATFPWLSLGLDEISLVHRGVVPAKNRDGQPPAPSARAEVRDHAAEGIEGAVSMIGVRYTTARLLAERTIDLVATKLERVVAPSRTSELPLLAPVRTGEPEPARPADGSPAERITRVYGATAARVLGLHAERPELGRPLGEGLAVTGAQVLEALRHEMALTLEDVVVRRTGLGAAGHPGDAIVRACAAVMREELGWSQERVEEEVATVRRFYEIEAEGHGEGCAG